MLKYLINAISRGLGFTKTEARGTLVMIFVIFCALILLKWGKTHLITPTSTPADSSTHRAWIEEVKSAFDQKKVADPIFDKTVYLPKKITAKADTTATQQMLPLLPEIPKEKIEVGDLNKASAEDLQKVKGIGPVFSERIIKYRSLLGGYARMDQLREVYGLSEETIAELSLFFKIQSEVEPIPLNTDSIKTLAKHPYISYDLARIIYRYRLQHGDFQSPDDLRKIKAIDEQTFLRLKPYLK